MTELPNPSETLRGNPKCPIYGIAASSAYRGKTACRCDVCSAHNTELVRQHRAKTPELEHGLSRYRSRLYKCRCEVCKAAYSEYARKRYANSKTALDEASEPPYQPRKRPPGIVWTDATDITAVVRCERCDKNYGPWLFDVEGAREFADEHRAIHLDDPPFDWAAYDTQRLFKGAGGRPAQEGPCSEEACLRDPFSKGLCQKHYMRAYRGAA